MKILHVVPYYYPAWGYGGPPRAVFELAKAQASQGHEVTILTTDAYTKDERLPSGEMMVDDVKVIRIRNFSNWLMWNVHFCTPLFFKELLSLEKYNAVHLHEVRTLLNVVVLFFLKPNAKVFISPWGTLPYNDNQVLIKKGFDYLFLNLFKNKIKIGFGQTDHECSEIRRFKIALRDELVPLGINVESFRELPSRQHARKVLQISNDQYSIVFLGRFAPGKGIDLLLNAFDWVNQKYPQTRLFLIGRDDGALKTIKETIKKLKLEKKVFIKPPLFDKERFLAYRGADVFVSTPVVYEETSTTCLEALACGCPVITTTKSAIPNLKSADGVSVIEDNTEDVYQAIIESIKSYNIPNREKILKLFDWEKISDILVKYYKYKNV